MLQQFKFKIIIILLVLFSLLNIDIVNAKNKNIVNIYFFHSNTCSHCKSERKLLDKLEDKYNNIKIYSYEIHENNNKEILGEVGKLYNINNISGVPVTIIGDTIYMGFSDEKGSSTFIKTIEYYSRYGYIDRVGNYLNIDTNNLYLVDDNDISLKEFMNNYNNYRLLFNIYSDDIDINYIGIVIGLLLGINIFMLLGLFIIIYKYKSNLINSLKYSMLYILISIILNTIYNIINIDYVGVIIMLLLDILYIITRKKDIINNYIFIILISSIMIVLSIYVYPNYLSMFNSILYLNNLDLVYVILYYIELYFIYIFILLVLLFIIMIILGRKKQSRN